MALMTPEIEMKVIEIVSKQLGVAKEKITPKSSFVNDLGADSLDTVELVMEIEDAFDLSIPDEAAEKIQTVGDAIRYIEDHLRDKK
jgi:acyl carrier protein